LYLRDTLKITIEANKQWSDERLGNLSDRK